MTDAPTSPDQTSVSPSPEAALWEVLQTGLQWMATLFGRPADLLADMARLHNDLPQLCAWLSSLEALARALLLVMAARFVEPAPAFPPPESRTHAGVEPAVATSTDDAAPTPPGAGRGLDVTFRVAPRTHLAIGAPGRRRPRRVDWAGALARRFEALVRIACEPEPYARALARRLRADPALPMRILRRPLASPGRRPPYHEAVDEAVALAWAAAQPPEAESG